MNCFSLALVGWSICLATAADTSHEHLVRELKADAAQDGVVIRQFPALSVSSGSQTRRSAPRVSWLASSVRAGERHGLSRRNTMHTGRALQNDTACGSPGSRLATRSRAA